MDGYVKIGTELDTKSFDAQIAELEYKLEDLEANYEVALKDAEFPEEEIKKYQTEIEKTKNKIIGLQKQQLALNQTSVDVGNGFKSSLKSLSKMGLAIFGIRSAYMLIRQSANQLADSNDQIAGKLTAIKGALANAIAPVAEALVNIVYKLLSYLNVITKMFFGVDLFKKTAKSAKSAVGSANKLKKTIAGFDEMNVLNDTSSGGGGGGGGAIQPEPIDTSNFEKWVEETKKQFDELVEINRVDMAKMLLEQDKTWGLLKLGWFDTIQGMARIVKGFVDVVTGIFDIIVGIAEGDNEKIEQGVQKLIEGIGGILLGLLQTVLGILEMIVGAIWGVLRDIVVDIYNKVIKPIGEFFKGLWDGIVSGVKSAVEKVKSVFNSVVTFFKNIISSIISLFKTIGTKVGDAVGGAFKSVINGVLKAIEGILNTPIRAINNLIGVINKVPGVNIGRLNTFSFPRLAKGGIINMPGRGIPLATGGERGAEGVIPLTDSQQMALLGEAIGRYINLNATIPVYVGNRQIARELRKIETENAFAGNR